MSPLSQTDHEQITARVFAASDFARRTAERWPEMLDGLRASGALDAPRAPGTIAAEVAHACVEAGDEEQLGRALRLARQREMLRICWRDIGGLAELDEILTDLSNLADACVQTALAHHRRLAAAQWGEPFDDRGAAVDLIAIGMGKLGGGELNFSSDIDLIFAYRADGETCGGRRSTSNHEYFTRIARAVTVTLESPRAEGFVFRVDTRLRPFGLSGPLAVSFAALEEYLHGQARMWERYAWIKARAIGARASDQALLDAIVRPFVFRRYLDFSAIEAIRDMKRMIEDEYRDRRIDDNVKLGRGGIREIEFIGQVFQLIRGGREPTLQARPIRAVLRRLARLGLLDEAVADRLDTAYCLLRHVENRLQQVDDQQVHVLPADDTTRARIATALDHPDWTALLAALDAARAAVHREFAAVFSTDTDAAAADRFARVWTHPQEAGSDAELGHAGFRDPPAARERIGQLRGSGGFRVLGQTGRARLDHLVPALIEEAAATPDPDGALERLLAVIEAIGGRSAYLALLYEHPAARTHLASLVGLSPWIAREIARQPILLDELLDPRRLYAPATDDRLMRELVAHLAAIPEDDLEEQMERLRQFAHAQMLRIAAADITGALPLMKVSDYLSALAEVMLRYALALAWTELTERHGVPGFEVDGVRRDAQFTIVAYGKLGGLELGYGSDLDIVFLHDSTGSAQHTNGERSAENAVFFTRLAQRIIHILTAPMRSGTLYEVDTRLRPNGKSGLLVSSFDAFALYQNDSAWTWEHQALIRARPVAAIGRPEPAFAAIRDAVLRRERDPRKLREEVVEMRSRMRAELDRSTTEDFDLKQGHGGITDIEFMVQYRVLRHAFEHPELTRWTDNIRLLETLAGCGLMPASDAGRLAEIYRRLRGDIHRASLLDRPVLIDPGAHAAERAFVQAQWQATFETP
ncbi:MAG: bifunctional [glutamate--ammonia ligase]-adenylyl-L-tyrosine phosphorylase/[glutamate--ammonia-ligase] adenylyltransferase [Chromatiales bacterium]|nr:bifunctional [glutamate--ammonia ligase]-adenylyl-L-tyrosine phosphorylase/[glutamate--ammonia-ligase] adenylyltransferase [Chromatiales bacterium]